GAVRAPAETLLARRDALMERISDLTPTRLRSVKTRCHGDLHLGHILVVENDLVVINFEGDPSRPLSERRAKRCPLVDVAGMVRSFDQVAPAALELMCRDHPAERERLNEPLARWSSAITQRFLAAYAQEASGSPSHPESAQQARDLIRLFCLQKALEEIRHALRNRPQWARVPIEGVLALLDSAD
ncbi:MAG: alpha-amylase, partial [Chromatiaceae bacterium]